MPLHVSNIPFLNHLVYYDTIPNFASITALLLWKGSPKSLKVNAYIFILSWSMFLTSDTII